MNIRRKMAGFTLIELIVVLVIASMFFFVGAPAVGRLFDTIQFRDTVRELSSAAKNARREALVSGVPVNFFIDTESNQYLVTRDFRPPSEAAFFRLKGTVNLSVTYAAEVSPEPGLAAIRFYPSGGSSGGDISIVRPSGGGMLLTVGWLLGDVTAHSL